MIKSFLRFGLLFLISFGNNCVKSENDLIVELPNGKIQGILQRNLISFRGIPYAEPPIGDNRFEDPKPYISKWTGIRNASNFGNECMKWDALKEGIDDDLLNGAEDCLNLHVYTPNIKGNEKYPVIVHIHGGGYMFGSGNTFGGELLLRKNKLVVVALNYRLGPLGFLSTKDDQISGNMGLKDQQLALRWIKQNIHIFNGNPENITITGWSAGGASVHFQILNEHNNGLFSAAISHSGTAFCAWVLQRNPLERAKKLASLLDCPTDNTRELKNCLKQKPAEDIVRAVRFFQPFRYNPFNVFGPVIESNLSRNAFITEEIENIIRSGKSLKVPWIVSYTQDDGGYNALTLLKKDKNGNELINSLNDKWKKLAPLMLFYNETTPVIFHNLYAYFIKLAYLGTERFSTKTYRKLQTMFTDYLYLYGIQKSLKLHINFSNAPVYIYHYNRSLPIGLGFIETGRKDIDFGSVHGDDVFLIFNNPEVSGYTESDLKMSEHFANLYESFATKRVPKFGNVIMPANLGSSLVFKMILINDFNKYKIENVLKLFSKPNVINITE